MFTKNVFTSIVLAGVLAFSSSAFAIRSVGNGGGLAEMRVVYLFQNLEYTLVKSDKLSLADNNSKSLFKFKSL